MAKPAASPQSHEGPRRVLGVRLSRLLVAAVALIYAVIFVALNRGKVRIHFLFFTVTSRLWVGFLVCLALGAVLGQAFGAAHRRRSAKPARPDAGGAE